MNVFLYIFIYIASFDGSIYIRAGHWGQTMRWASLWNMRVPVCETLLFISVTREDAALLRTETFLAQLHRHRIDSRVMHSLVANHPTSPSDKLVSQEIII